MIHHSARIIVAFASLCLTSLPTFASPVQFTFSGVGIFESPSNTATGSFVIDDSLFDQTAFQFLPNSNITQLSFTTTSSLGTTTFGFADIVPGDVTFYDSFNLPPSIAGGGGTLATTSGLFLLIGGTNQMSLSTSPNSGTVEFYTGSWTAAAVAETPLPAALPLFATILAGGGLVAWRRKRKAAKLAA